MRSPSAKEIAATARAEMKRRRHDLLTLVRHLDALIAATPDTLTRLDVAVLRQQRAELLQHADGVKFQMGSRSWLYHALLQAAKHIGIKLSYTAPVKGKPYGPGIEYLMTTAAQCGYPIGPERAHRLLVEFNRSSFSMSHEEVAWLLEGGPSRVRVIRRPIKGTCSNP
jgi:hypothetical protein